MTSTNFADAQRDMRDGYCSGAPGVFASALAWVSAGAVALLDSPKHAVIALFIGGMFIHPLGMLIAKMLGRRGSHTRGNPLGVLALEGTFLLLLCLPLAYVVSAYRLDWFFPAMLLIIGGRYLTFSTLYGLRIYWGLGACLALTAFALIASGATPVVGVFSGAAIELAFAAVIYGMARRASEVPLAS
jgi:hypothetical protein